MRIGAFEFNCSFHSSFVLAQVINGQAYVMRSIHIRNVRGDESDWLKFSVLIGDKRTRQKALRHLPVGDEKAAFHLEQEILHALTVPESLGEGSYPAVLIIDESEDRHEIPFTFEVLGADLIPTDFVRSVFLASYLKETDDLRSFAAMAVSEAPSAAAADTLTALYNAVLAKQLHYQPPVAVRIPDCQRISDLEYVIRYGGSCADLALLFASLLWCRDVSPVLLLFPDHMAPGCFSENCLPEYLYHQDPTAILHMMEAGSLIILEATDVCSSQPGTCSQSINKIRERLQYGREPCRLLNIKQILRSGIRLLPEKTDDFISCPACGFPRITTADIETGCCPACGEHLFGKQTGLSAQTAMIEFAGPDLMYYRTSGHQVVADKLRDPKAAQIRIRDTWQGRPVRSLGERALAGSFVEKVFLPDVLTGIGDYAFHGCRNLKQIVLPGTLKTIGTGAFCGSALNSVRIPDTVRKIPRMAFSGCLFLEEVTLPEGLEEIGERAFAECPKLRRIRIPAAVNRIGRNAFDRSCELWLRSDRTRIEH